MGKIDIADAVYNFYVLEGIKSFFPKADIFSRAHDKWVEEVTEYAELYTSNLAKIFYDYTIKALAGELRHSYTGSTHFLPEFCQERIQRQHLYHDVERLYSDTSVIKMAKAIFNRWWSSGYGGQSWKNIADAAEAYKKWSTVIWLDHMVDLSHNHSYYIDKPNSVFVYMSEHYMRVLDFKRSCDTEDLFTFSEKGYAIKQFIKRGITLGIIPKVNLTDRDFYKWDTVEYGRGEASYLSNDISETIDMLESSHMESIDWDNSREDLDDVILPTLSSNCHRKHLTVREFYMPIVNGKCVKLTKKYREMIINAGRNHNCYSICSVALWPEEVLVNLCKTRKHIDLGEQCSQGYHLYTCKAEEELGLVTYVNSETLRITKDNLNNIKKLYEEGEFYVEGEKEKKTMVKQKSYGEAICEAG